MQSTYLTAHETAERLGIKRDTLYAYVSRGLLRSVAAPGSRERGYRADEVEKLRAGRGTSRAGRNEPLIPVIDSAICLIEDGRLYYRGIDAIHLAETAMSEDIADLLWAGATPTLPHKRGREARRASGGRVGAEAPLGLIERCQIRLATLAAADLAALDLTPAGIIRTGRNILYELAACAGGTPPASAPVHRQLAAYWGLDDKGADLVRRCLVLLADHELNASTFAAALSALSGRLHGGASASAEALLHEIVQRGDPLAVMAARLARNEHLPGLGHPLYPEGDPRADALLSAAMAAVPGARRLIEVAIAAARQLIPQPANVDFALAAATTALGLPQGAALSLFVVGRTVGWIAHAIEQYQNGVLIRPRARYTGVRPEPEESHG